MFVFLIQRCFTQSEVGDQHCYFVKIFGITKTTFEKVLKKKY